MEIIRNAGSDELLALRGGCCNCATCRVHVAPGINVGPAGTDEDNLLESSDHRTDRSRLSRRIAFDDAPDGLTVRIADED